MTTERLNVSIVSFGSTHGPNVYRHGVNQCPVSVWLPAASPERKVSTFHTHSAWCLVPGA